MDTSILCGTCSLSRYVYIKWATETTRRRVFMIRVVFVTTNTCLPRPNSPHRPPPRPALYFHVVDKADRLNIQFYEATYNPSFASIFPTVDICALVPKEHAHVCILEEPEHLNWMRIVSEEMDPTKVNNNNEKNEKGETKPKKTTPTKENSTQTDAGTSTTGNPNTPTKLDLIEINKLGWQAKFDFVVGILHTNYDAYVRQYGMGAAFLAASALQALSTLCTRAYCHKVIRLSDTLPALNTSKEVTCNVHGVMTEFLQAPPPSIAALSEDEEDENSVTQKESDQACSDKKDDQEEDKDLSPIYFIGKLVGPRPSRDVCSGILISLSHTSIVYIDLGQGI